MFCVACVGHRPAQSPRPTAPSRDNHSSVPLKGNRDIARSVCPTGTEQFGAGPPEGDMLWCVDGNGKNHGPFKTWYASGQIESEGTYANGVRVGTWRYWSASGELKGVMVRIDVCVYERSSGRALEDVILVAHEAKTERFFSMTTDNSGLATLWVSPGKYSVAIGQSPFFRSSKEIEIRAPLTVTFDLDDEARRNLTTRSAGRLSAVAASCRTPSASAH